MPQYEYRCPADQSMIELYQSFEDSSIPNCPQCGQQMNKQFNTPPGDCLSRWRMGRQAMNDLEFLMLLEESIADLLSAITSIYGG